MATIQDGTGVLALAAFDESAQLKLLEFARPEPGPMDVAIDIQFCGICHTDVHYCNGDWHMNMFPLAPGHEIAGLVRKVGSKVTHVKVGDRVAVGCQIECCRSCELCKNGLEQNCLEAVRTYGSVFPEGKGANFDKAVGYHTNGGYSTEITVNGHFVYPIPDNMDLEYAGVLLCAGITMFSPLNRHMLQKGGGKGKHVGIVGFGGLGQMGVKLAKAMGADVTVFSRSRNKAAKAKELGADILVHTNDDELKAAFRKFDVVLDTVSAKHEVAPLVNTIKVGGVYVLIGGVAEPFEISARQMLWNRQSIEGTGIGGVPETKEMLEFCSKHKIVPEYKVIHARDASEHFQSLMDGSADAMRAVIDISTLKELA